MTDERRQEQAFTPELARRLQRALVAEGEEIFLLVQDAAPEVLRALLKNRRLAEEHLLAMLKRRDLSDDLLKALHQHELTTACHRLKVALAAHPKTPTAVVQALLPHLHLFDLLGICLLPGSTPDQKLASERAIVQRLPGVPLGNRIVLARRAPSSLLGELLKGGEPPVVAACLDNPLLKELSLVQFLAGPLASAVAIAGIVRHPRWQNLPTLRLAIVKHPNTPEAAFRSILPTIPLFEVKNLRHSRRLSPTRKQLIEDELQRRCPT